MIFLLTGSSGSGKTTLLRELAGIFRLNHKTPGGFIAPGTWLNGQRSGFMLTDLENNKEYPLAVTGITGAVNYGRFVFDEKTLEFGNNLLIKQMNDPNVDLIIVDEVGPFELAGKGWAGSLDMLAKSEKPQVWAVRPPLADEVSLQWALNSSVRFSATEDPAMKIYRKIAEICSF